MAAGVVGLDLLDLLESDLVELDLRCLGIKALAGAATSVITGDYHCLGEMTSVTGAAHCLGAITSWTGAAH